MTRRGKSLLVLALVAVVAMAFRVSWNALRDIARAVGADQTAATLYPVVVDGLMALALVATLVLVGPDRRFALRVLGTYTAASLVLNYVHGLAPGLHGRAVDWGRLADWGPANWLLVLLATSLPVGSIYFGSDLVAKVLHHQPAPTAYAEESDQTEMIRSTADLPESAPPPVAVNPTRILAAVQVGFLKPVVPPKPLPSTVLGPIGQTSAAQSARPRRATGRVPQSARSTQPRRSPDQLLTEARVLTAGWPDADLTAERLRRELHTAPATARTLRDTLRAERVSATAAV
ncbi:DUF2637 domain-containing protein [Streptomyces sp. cg36]|uniref:DUF2637 domain-containing protein n=1 Tax=Streptomyces sp. cg36 TaxID=3238798 RepID=UPI0034E1D893